MGHSVRRGEQVGRPDSESSGRRGEAMCNFCAPFRRIDWRPGRMLQACWPMCVWERVRPFPVGAEARHEVGWYRRVPGRLGRRRK